MFNCKLHKCLAAAFGRPRAESCYVNGWVVILYIVQLIVWLLLYLCGLCCAHNLLRHTTNHNYTTLPHIPLPLHISPYCAISSPKALPARLPYVCFVHTPFPRFKPRSKHIIATAHHTFTYVMLYGLCCTGCVYIAGGFILISTKCFQMYHTAQSKHSGNSGRRVLCAVSDGIIYLYMQHISHIYTLPPYIK